MPTTTRQVYGMYVANAAKVPHDFLQEMSARIDLGHDMSETPEMLAQELELRYSLRVRRTKTPRQLAKSVMKVHDQTIASLKQWVGR